MKVSINLCILYNIFILVIGEKSFNTIPQLTASSFSCKNRDTGFYADIKSNCQIYHTCDDHGNKFSYNCPQDTVFNQETLVCDHTYRVDCQKSAKLILQDVKTQEIEKESIESDNTQNANKFSRFFRITPQPSAYFLAPKENNTKSSVFNVNSSTLIKDQSNSGSNQDFFKSSRNLQLNKGNLFSSVIKTPSVQTTMRTYQLKRDDPEKFSSRVDKQKILNSQRNIKVSDTEFQQLPRTTTIKSSIISNDPYSGTLRSIQNNNKITSNKNNNKNNLILSTIPPTTAGTDFPIPNFEETIFSGLTNFNDDPYYPRYTTSTEGYTLETIDQTPFSFTTQKIRTTNLKLDLLDVLPDLNSVEDLVDRRKHLFIPITKSI